MKRFFCLIAAFSVLLCALSFSAFAVDPEGPDWNTCPMEIDGMYTGLNSLRHARYFVGAGEVSSESGLGFAELVSVDFADALDPSDLEDLWSFLTIPYPGSGEYIYFVPFSLGSVDSEMSGFSFGYLVWEPDDPLEQLFFGFDLETLGIESEFGGFDSASGSFVCSVELPDASFFEPYLSRLFDPEDELYQDVSFDEFSRIVNYQLVLLYTDPFADECMYGLYSISDVATFSDSAAHGLYSVMNWCGSFLTALLDGVLNPLLPALGVIIGISALKLGAGFVRSVAHI